MIVQANQLEDYLNPEEEKFELRMPNRTLASDSLPYLEAWRLVHRGLVEGKVAGSRLKYLRLLSEDELRQREQEKASTESHKSSSTVVAKVGIGVRKQKLRELIVEEDPWGRRTVVGEGEVRGWTYQLELSSL